MTPDGPPHRVAGELECGQLLRFGPADEVSGLVAEDGVVAGQPGVEVALLAGGQRQFTGVEPAEQGDGGFDVLLNHDGLVVGGFGVGEPAAASAHEEPTIATRSPPAPIPRAPSDVDGEERLPHLTPPRGPASGSKPSAVRGPVRRLEWQAASTHRHLYL